MPPRQRQIYPDFDTAAQSMAASIDDIQNLYVLAHGNASELAGLKAAFAECAAGYKTKGAMNSILGASKNSVSYQAAISIPENVRATILRRAIQFIEANTYPSSRSYGRF